MSRKQSSPSAIHVNGHTNTATNQEISQASTLASSVSSPRSPQHQGMSEEQRRAIDLLEARGLRGFAVYGDVIGGGRGGGGAVADEKADLERAETASERLRRIERDMV